jgi:hypothetical protein
MIFAIGDLYGSMLELRTCDHTVSKWSGVPAFSTVPTVEICWPVCGVWEFDRPRELYVVVESGAVASLSRRSPNADARSRAPFSFCELDVTSEAPPQTDKAWIAARSFSFLIPDSCASLSRFLEKGPQILKI